MWENQKDMQMAVSMTSPSTGVRRQGDQDQPTAGTIPSPSFFSTAKPDKAVHRSICGLAPCFSARDPCIFCPRTVLRVRGQAITTAS